VAIRVLVHVLNEETVLADVERLPEPQDNCVIVNNPRRRDGKPLPLLADGVTTVVYPWTRITYLEVLDKTESASGGNSESIVGFFRESGRDTP
jgi:hypothetical protein